MVETLKNCSFLALANIEERLFKKDDNANVYKK